MNITGKGLMVNINKPKFMIVLEYLLTTGNEIDLSGIKVKLVSDGKGYTFLSSKLDHLLPCGSKKTEDMSIDLSFNQFVVECDKLTDGEVASLSGTMALKDWDIII